MKIAIEEDLRAPTTALGRADLLRFIGQFGEKKARQMAEILGLELAKKEISLTELPKQQKIKPIIKVTKIDEPPEPPSRRVTHYEPWHLTEFEPAASQTHSEPKWYQELEPLTKTEKAASYSKAVPCQPPILHWSRLWPFLRGALGQWRESGKVRIPKVLESLITGHWPKRVPREKRLTWASQCHIILDFSLCLRPFWDDFKQLLPALEKVRGKAGFNIWVTDKECGELFRKYRQKNLQLFPQPALGTPVLVLGDLGMYSTSISEKQRWLDFGEKLKQLGCTPVALVPCPRSLWNASIAKIWHLAAWDESERLPQIRATEFSHLTPSAREDALLIKKTNYLLSFLSPAVRVEPELLREARKILPQAKTNISSEYYFWNHDLVQANLMAAAINPEARKLAQHTFASFGESTCNALLAKLALHHAWLSEAIHWEEQMTGKQLLGQPCEQANTYFQRLSKEVNSDLTSLGAYVDRLSERQLAEMFKTFSGLAITWVKRYGDAVEKGLVAIPKGLDYSQWRRFAGREGKLERWWLFQQGNELLFQQFNVDFEKDWQVKTLLGTMTLEGGLVYGGAGKKGMQQFLPINSRSKLTLLSSNVEHLNGHDGQFTLAKLLFDQRPFWMRALGSDRRGLFGELKDQKKGCRRVYWVPPGALRLENKQEETAGTWNLKKGCWMAEEQFNLFETGTFTQPNWADNFGVDDYGIYADWNFKMVTQRFRWIFPGSFTMGSPETEKGRNEKETLHEVVITRGFWMADTVCTKGFWEINQIKSNRTLNENLPILDVSWNRVKKWLTLFNNQNQRVEWRLPSESEWEYACRAGTQTAFSFGDHINTDLANYSGKFKFDSELEFERRESLMPAKFFKPNPWGLFQMHGNVWEWCEDWLEDYSPESKVDPLGPDNGIEKVLRGGSWIFDGKYCRSASRDGDISEPRSSNIGFRLVRNQ